MAIDFIITNYFPLLLTDIDIIKKCHKILLLCLRIREFNLMNRHKLWYIAYKLEERNEEIKSSVGVICTECNQSAPYFKKKNSDFNQEKQCIICQKTTLNGILLEDFLFTLKEHVKDHYELVEGNLSDTLSIKEVLKRFTYDNNNVLEKLSNLLCEKGETFFQLDGRYKSTVDASFINKSKHDALKLWSKIANELKHKQRFTHTQAANFYNDLIESCNYIIENGDIFNSALTVIKKDHDFFRARLVKDESYHRLITSDPEKQLSAPPNYLATNSRMSPPGISFMYTAGDPETAIAELRPYVGDVIAIGIFKNTRDLKFFDFTRLDDIQFADANILENPKYFRNRYILKELHKLISKPYRATDTSYIETQMFAETIRNYNEGYFDGIIFGSSQRDEGLNYVIFGDSSTDQDVSPSTNNYHVVFDSNKQVTFYQVTKIQAISEKLVKPIEPSD